MVGNGLPPAVACCTLLEADCVQAVGAIAAGIGRREVAQSGSIGRKPPSQVCLSRNGFRGRTGSKAAMATGLLDWQEVPGERQSGSWFGEMGTG